VCPTPERRGQYAWRVWPTRAGLRRRSTVLRLRRLIPRKVTATAVTGILGTAGALVLAPSAHAAPLEWTSQCVNQDLPGMHIDPSQTKVEISVDPVKPTYKVGEVITVHWKWLAYSNVPLDTPIVTQVDKDSTLPKGKITLSGGDSREMDVEGERINPETPLGEPLIITDMKGPLLLTKPGATDLTPARYATFTQAFGFDSETRCLPTTPPPVGTSIDVEPGEVELPELDAPDEVVYVGSDVALTGSGFAPNAVPKVSLCAASGLECDERKFWKNSLAIDAQGNLTGDATLYPFGIDDGAYVVRVFDGLKEATDPVSIKTFVPGVPTLVADKSSGPTGTVVHLEGTDWRANYDLTVGAVDADGNFTETTINAPTTPDGKFSADYTVGTGDVVAIKAVDDREPGATVPFTLTQGGSLTQSLVGTINPGGLSVTQTGSTIDLGSITLNGREQTLSGALNQVTVVDARGTDLGWQLTGAVSALTSENGTIPATDVAWTPSCAAVEGSPSTVTAGTAGPLGTGATLCSQAPSPGTPTGGTATADAELTVITPAFIAPGTYTATLTLTLS